ncbi:peptide ABC transporter ATP-binding protein [Halorubrum rubrum]|uniref:Peptide ABC transporter ATP-binding protein n=1 Tax=Halorubrum rubrum TaxID=1126240 RepID=A0ABD5R1D3_9EURY|nr:peptide ABC transporter ATP-binding protein [Halorubrum rubrum]
MNGSDASAPLSITTDDLSLAIDGVRMEVRATGDRVFVEVPTALAALRLARRLPNGLETTGPTRFLLATGLTTEIRVRGRTVLVLGSTARPGPLARRLGVAPAEVRLAGLVGAGWSGLSAAVDAVRRLLG